MEGKKRSASDADLTSDQLPKRVSKDRKGKAKYEYPTTHGGKDVIFKTTITADRKEGSHCTNIYNAQFTLDTKNSKGDRKVGYLYAYVIDMSTTLPHSRVPAFVKEYLTMPPDYDYDPVQHSGNGDPLDDIQKMCQIMLTPGGEIRYPFWEKLKYVGDGPKILIISNFLMYKTSRGRNGFAQHAMASFFLAMAKMSNDFDYVSGPAFLAPAPITAELLKMEQQLGVTIDPVEAKRKIMESYKRSLFKPLHEGDSTNIGEISIMWQMLPQPLADLPKSTMFGDNSDVKDTPLTAATLMQEEHTRLRPRAMARIPFVELSDSEEDGNFEHDASSFGGTAFA